MKKTHILTAVLAAASLTACDSGKKDTNIKTAAHKCEVVKDGVGLIKEGKADCAFTRPDGTKGSCAGQNVAGDPSAWIFVTDKAACDKINAGDFSGDAANYQDKIESN